MEWQELEVQVRQIAEAHWNAPCEPRTLHGVKCDGVIELSSDHWVAIEISKENTLAKLREDLAKFSTIRPAQFSKNIYTECLFVTLGETSSLKDSARNANVQIYSVEEFSAKFTGQKSYNFNRNKRQFGSAVDPDTGVRDTSIYTEISYSDYETGSQTSLEDIASYLRNGEEVVLMGEFGSGKSRCVQELFQILCEDNTLYPTICINLRECWGLRTFDLILRNHMDSLGLSEFADNVVKLASAKKVRVLLDGFDEIGSQSWTGEAERLREIRRKSLEGVRDLVTKCSGAGIFICGREHYFSSNEEMFECIGLDKSVKIISCPEEFSDEELEHYLISNTSLESVPSWMPRKPLVCQLVAKLDQNTLNEITSNVEGEIDFFERVLDAICQRETRIHPSIDALTLRGVLLGLAEKTRDDVSLPEELSPQEINSVFYEVSGLTPLDESAVMLQRLPYLGRVGSGNPNRVFIDDYAKSGLKGLALADSFLMNDREVSRKRWKKPVGELGNRILAAKISSWRDAEKFANYCNSHGNCQVNADYLCGRLAGDEYHLDMSGLQLDNVIVDVLDFSDRKINGLIIRNSYIEKIILDGSEFESCWFEDILCESVEGIGSKEWLPTAFQESCSIDRFSEIENVARISELPLSNRQKTLIAIIKKLFFQPGRGRKEEALLRGTSAYWDSEAADEVLRYMLRTGIVTTAPGNRGKLYIPQRRHSNRMAALVEEMSTSKDELWVSISKT